MNGGTYAVVSKAGGHASMTAGFTREAADRFAGELPGLLDLDGPPEVVDLLPELEQRFPAGTPVWLGKTVHWRRGQAGTVAAGELDTITVWPQASPSPWSIASGGASVYVVLDDDYASWWPAGWLETR